MGKLSPAIGAFVYLIAIAPPAASSESTIYTYDALGRLVTVTVSGGPNDGRQASTTFDSGDNRTNYSMGGTAPTASFSVADASVTEGGTVTVTVTRAGVATGAAAVSYATSNGSASAPGDYTSTSGTLTFAAGETSKSISIATTNDSVYEGIETFGVVLSSPSPGTSISNGNATVTILDNEVVAELAISNTTIIEGGTAALTVTRSGLTTSAVGVSYATLAGTATAPADFAAASGTLSFLAGETSKAINFTTVNDTLYEGTEAFSVALSAATGGAVITSGTGAVTVTDNDNAPSFAISNASAAEGGTIALTVTKSGASANSLSVNYGTANGSANAPGDYGAASGTLTFLPADTSKTISVSTVNDSIYETNESFSVHLSGASGGATISDPTGVGTINDNDSKPTLSMANTSVMEGGQANVVITKSGTTEVNATASYTTSNGTATSTDYYATSGTLTFYPEETTKIVQILTIDNNKYNVPKTINLGLSGATDATISTPTAVVTINNDEPMPSFNVASTGYPALRIEGGIIDFSITLSGIYEAPLSVNYTTSSGIATSGVDFTPVSGTLTFTPPTATQTVSVQTTQDSLVEPDETFFFTISSPSSGATIANSQSVGTIQNDDVPPSNDPVANTDNAGTSFVRCDSFTINPLTNDTSPSGKYPLSLISVATGSGYTRTISGNNVTFNILAGGAKTVQYIVANSVGAQATGTITWTAASGPVCNSLMAAPDEFEADAIGEDGN